MKRIYRILKLLTTSLFRKLLNNSKDTVFLFKKTPEKNYGVFFCLFQV
jgi:hypothetical protein